MFDDFVSQAKELCVLRWLLLIAILEIPHFTSESLFDLEWTDLPIILGGLIAWGLLICWRRKVAERKVRAKHRVVIADLDRRLDRCLNGADSK